MLRTRTLDEPRRRIADTEPCPPPVVEGDTIPVPPAEMDRVVADRMAEQAWEGQ